MNNKNNPFRELRAESGLTQQQFAEKFNIPKRTIENWDSGTARPPQYVIESLKNLFEYEKRSKKMIKNSKIEKIDEISNDLINYAANLPHPVIDTLRDVPGFDETILAEFIDEWDSIEVDAEGATDEQDERLDKCLFEYAVKLSTFSV